MADERVCVGNQISVVLLRKTPPLRSGRCFAAYLTQPNPPDEKYCSLFDILSKPASLIFHKIPIFLSLCEENMRVLEIFEITWRRAYKGTFVFLVSENRVPAWHGCYLLILVENYPKNILIFGIFATWRQIKVQIPLCIKT